MFGFLNEKKKRFYDLKKPIEMSNLNPISTADLIEIDAISENGIFRSCGNIYSKVFLLDDLNYSMMMYKEQINFLGSWCKVLNSFGVFVQLHIFNKNRNMENFRNTVLFRKKMDGFDTARTAYNDIVEGKIVNGKQGIQQVKFISVSVKKTSYEDAKNLLTTVESNLKKEFLNIGSGLVLLNGTERLRILHDFWRIGEEELFDINISNNYLMEGICDWKNDIVPSFVDFESYPDRVITEKGIYSAFYLEPKNYPNTLSDKFFDELININSCSLFTLSFIDIPRDCVESTLQDKLLDVEHKIEKQQKSRNDRKQFSSDISLKVRTDKKDIEEMIHNVHENDQEMFWIDTNFVVFGENERKFEQIKESIFEIADKHTLKLKAYSKWQRQAINTALPLGIRQTKESRTMFTQTAAIFIPFNVLQIKYSQEPIYYGICQIDKNPILASRKYDLFNGNGFVFGVPGSGKSFTGAKMEMGSVFLNSEDHILVVDPTLEYIDVSNAFDGTVLEFATYAKKYINPLEVRLDLLSPKDENGIIRDKIEFMTGLCQQNMDDEFKAGHKSIINRVTKRVFVNMAELPLEKRRQLLIGDIYDEVKKEPEILAEDLALALEIFVDGALDIFNHETNIRLDNRIIVFGTRDMGENLRPSAMLVMMEFITNRILENFEKGIATHLYVDEFHELCNKEYTMLYLVTLWAKVRKLGGLCTGITQNIIRVMEKEITKTLVCNSEYTLFLKQGEPDIDVILENFPDISTAMVKYIRNAAKGTGLIRFGNTIIPFDNSIEKENPIYDVFNTNFHEKMAEKRQKEEKQKTIYEIA